MVGTRSDAIEKFERCRRLYRWDKDYIGGRIKPLAALYESLTAGLLGGDSKTALMSLAASPGLDLNVQDIYGTAVHLSFLAEILTAYLKGPEEWVKSGEVWESGPDLRRIVLCSTWNEETKMREIRSWRTLLPVCTEDRPMLLNFISIGSTVEGRRVSPWTRAWAHPKNNALRFKKKDGESLGPGWEQVWRERANTDVMRWLSIMQRDRVFDDLVHSVKVPVPARRDEYLEDIGRIQEEMAALPENPPMNRGGCYRFSPCEFVSVCHGPQKKTPGECGWIKVSDVKNSVLAPPTYANV